MPDQSSQPAEESAAGESAVGEEQPGDYGYDLAHEFLAGDQPRVSAREEHPPPAYVVTETTDEGQDYSYDLAHEIRRERQK